MTPWDADPRTGAKNPQEQVEVLQRLMGIFGQEPLLIAIKGARSAQDIVGLLGREFEKGGIAASVCEESA